MSWLDRLLGGWTPHEDDAPAAAIRGDPARVRAVLAVLDELRPMFRADAGDVDLVAVEDGWVEVRLRGACRSCHASDTTVYGALEPRLKERLAWVVGVRAA
jgi:Fe-S cluster biogenesis protein NfuA